MNPDLFVRYDVNFFAAFLLLTILVAMHRRRDGFNFSARLFRLLVSVNLSMLILEVLSWEFDGRAGQGYRLANYLTNWIFLWLSPLIVSVWASYIDFRIFSSRERLRRRLYYAGPVLVSTVLLTISLFEPLVFSVSADNVYSRGPWLWVNLGVSYAVLVYVTAMALRRRRQLQSRLVFIILVLVMIPAAGALVQMLFYGVLTIWPLMAMVLVLTYVFLENYNASVDHLTGLFNRVRAEEYILSLMESSTPFAVVLIDLDDFKAINDSYGHAQGDQALILFGKALQEVFRGERLIARFGGDEFLVVTTILAPELLRRREDELNRLLRARDAGNEQSFRISFSYGFARFDPEKPVTYEELFIAADQQMYAEKRQNKHLRRRADDTLPEVPPAIETTPD